MTSLRNDIILSDDFEKVGEGRLGTHSVRKAEATHADNNNCSVTEIGQRGRWKQQGNRIVHLYIATTLAYPDAKAAGKLCIGGPVKYSLKPNCGINEDWMFKHVVPNIRKRFKNNVSNILGTALLWACLDPDFQKYLPVDMVSHVCSAYENVCTFEDKSATPVEKVCLFIYNNDGALVIDEMVPVGEAPPLVGENVAGSNTLNMYELKKDDSIKLSCIYTKISEYGHRHDEGKTLIESKFSEVRRNMQLLSRNIQTIGIPSYAAVVRGDRSARTERSEHVDSSITVTDDLVDETDYVFRYSLSGCPKTLNQLWVEYDRGIGGRAPAKNFTSIQRGKVTKTYYKRNLVWRCIATLIRSGHTAESACANIYSTYGESLSVTNIMKRFQRDKKTGGHPDLRVGPA